MEHQRMWGRYPRLGLRGKISRKSRLLPCQSRGFLRHFTSIQFLDMKSLTGQINRELIMLDWHFMGVGKKRCNTLDGLPIEMTNVCRFHGPTKKMFRCTLTTHGASNHHPVSEIQRNMSNQKRSHGLGMVPPSQYKQCWGLGGRHHPYSSTQIWHFWPLISWLIPSGVINHALVENLPFSTMLSHSNLHLVRGFPC